MSDCPENECHDLTLLEALETASAQALGRVIHIAQIQRQPSPYATSVPVDILTITSTEGEKLSIFAKYLSADPSDHPEKRVRDREPRVYASLLSNAALPVARHLGSRFDRSSNCFEVYLEHVDAWSLQYHQLAYWYSAARELARLHRYFATRSELLQSTPYLLRLDRAYFREWAGRAQDTITRHVPEHSGAIRWVSDRFDGAVDILLSQPKTLVHNDLSPKNVIADPSKTPTRICFVDWEMAAVGCGLLDLVHLMYGLDTRSRRKMCTAYCDELAETGLLPADHKDCFRLFAACELHKTLYRLAMSEQWNVSYSVVSQWLTEAHSLLHHATEGASYPVASASGPLIRTTP